MNGNLVAEKGSPNSSGVFWNGAGDPPDENIELDSRLRSIFNKQAALDRIFSVPNKMLEFQPWDGTAPFKAIISTSKLTFDRSENWETHCPYSIEMTASRVWIGNNEQPITPPSGLFPEVDTWSIDLSDEKFNSYKLTHTVASTQKPYYDELGSGRAGWEVAREVVSRTVNGKYVHLDDPHTGEPSGILDNPMSLLGHKAYNKTKSSNIDKSQGKFSFTENWLLYNPSGQLGMSGDVVNIGCLEDYTIDEKTDESRRKRVTVQGTLTGLEEYSSSGVINRYDNANRYWEYLRPRLPSVVGADFNPFPLNTSVGKNKKSGVITFSQEYDDRPTGFPGAISTKVVVSDTQPADIFASLTVLGRQKGPLLQSMSTFTSRKRTVSIDIVMPGKKYNGGYIPKPNTDALLETYRPVNSFRENDNDSWDEQNGKYNRSTTFVYEL